MFGKYTYGILVKMDPSIQQQHGRQLVVSSFDNPYERLLSVKEVYVSLYV